MYFHTISNRIVRGGLLTGLLALLGTGSAVATNCYTISPSSLNIQFVNQAVGTTSTAQQGITIDNQCATTLQITSITVQPSEFLLSMGYTWNIPAKQEIQYGLRFRPDAAQTFNGTITLGLASGDPIVLNITGTGITTGAVASLTSSALTFTGVQPGKTATQKVTLTNTGTTPMTVESVYTEPPFVANGYTGGGAGTVLQPGGTLPLTVGFSPLAAGSYNGTVVITSDVLNPVGVTLTATAVAPTALGITSFATLPTATQGAKYSATLTAAGGTPPYTWSLGGTSKLPTGLTLSSAGVISGTLPSTLKTGTYKISVQVKDSTSKQVSATNSMAVAATTGATCNNISWNVGGTGTPLVPITELGTGTYLGVEGGLYPNGSNIMPASHDSAGLALANAIQPLDANGSPDPNGKYGLLSLGLSVTFENYFYFQQAGLADTSLNSHLVLVNGANPNLTAARYANPADPIWTTEMDFFLPNAGVTANQIVAAWVMVIDGYPTGTFPNDMVALQGQYESIANNLHNKFPNLTMAFFSSRDYSGYSNGRVQPDDPEPYAYETAFAVRGMIEDQLNGNSNLNYNPNNGPVMAPWLSWADYDWANGMIPRSDGLVWTCQDFLNDGTHNSLPVGREKDANMLMNFFKTDDATTPWFLAPGARK
ncbi:MAG: choice-of-anchor D domain-containing protein [Candidatus Sulfotelmatobacter sp.]|jgi:hypothetical protein